MEQKRVLIADDSPTVRMTLSQSMTSAGHGVVAVANGAEAVDRLKTEQFDLLLLDVEMPVLNGFEVLTLMRDGKVAYPAPVLVSTGTRKSLGEVHELRRRDALGYIDKSMPVEELLFRVNRVLAGNDAPLV